MNDFGELFDGESVILSFRRHGILFFYRVIGFCILGAVPFLAWFILKTPLGWPDMPLIQNVILFVSTLWLCVLWVTIFYFWTIHRLEQWFITDRRLIAVEHAGLFQRDVQSFTLEEIGHVEFKSEGMLQGLFRYGTVEVVWKDNSYLLLTGVPRPERIEQALQETHLRIHDLEEAAQKEQEALRLVAHEVKGHLGRNAALLSGIVHGDFGDVSAPLKTMADRALTGTRAGVGEVMDILSTQGDAAAHVSLNKEVFDVRDEVRTIIERERPVAEEKGLTLTLAEDPHPCTIMGDKQTLRERVIRNLVENAVNYTQTGSVTAGVTTAEDNVILWVQDTGVGITPDDMTKLFTQGGKGAHSQDVNPNSTGFGLFAARQVVEAHGGQIWAESDGADTGAKFFVAIPVATQPQ